MVRIVFPENTNTPASPGTSKEKSGASRRSTIYLLILLLVLLVLAALWYAQTSGYINLSSLLGGSPTAPTVYPQ